MILMYLLIVLFIFIIIHSVYGLIQLIIYGNIPKKQVMTKAFQRLEGRKSSGRITLEKDSAKNAVSNYFQTFLVCIALFTAAFFLFRSMLPSILLAMLGLIYPKLKSMRDEKKLKDIMLLQFREAILSMANSLRAGSSLQVALQRSETDLERELKFEKNRPMLEKLSEINNDIRLGKPIEEVLLDFKRSSDLEDIHQFIDAIVITRGKGGNLADVINNTASSISDKIMIQQEIKLATSQKRMEAGILTFMPIGLVTILMVLNPGYMEPMYDTTLGTVLLFAAVLMLVANYFIGRKITNIEI